jgi:pimeloyl-ACP methyl ester carboxylesterase
MAVGERTGARFFEFDGHRLAYDERGGSDRTVVLLPGLLLPRHMQDPLADRLAQSGNRVLCLDLLGHGESDRPPGATRYSMSRFADQVVALLDHLGIDQAVVGGTSLGANVSLETAARWPERVRGLVLEMPVLDAGHVAGLVIFTPGLLWFRYGARALRPLTVLARRAPRLGPHLADVLLDWMSQDPAHAANVLHGLSYGRTAPPRHERERITAPTLVIAHTMDPLHALGDSEAAVRDLPRARLTRARTFFEMRFAPGRLSREIAAFVGGCWSGEGLEPESTLARAGGG